MTAVAFDTLQIVKDLRAAGFTEEQAEAVTRAVKLSQDVDLTSLATTADLKSEVASVHASISEAKAEILKWVFGTIGFQTLVILGAVIALARLIRP